MYFNKCMLRGGGLCIVLTNNGIRRDPSRDPEPRGERLTLFDGALVHATSSLVTDCSRRGSEHVSEASRRQFSVLLFP